MPRRRTSAAEYQQRLLWAQQLVQERLDERIDPAELAQAAHFSLHHFHRIFRAQMGETVMHYVRRLRLERAARHIKTRDVRLLDVALEAGYESHEAFSRAFVERFGRPPSLFREQSSERDLRWEQTQRLALPSVPVRVARCAAQRVAFMRHRGSYATVGQTWQKMVAWAGPRGLIGTRPSMYGVCPDDPQVTEEAFLRFDACVAIDDDFADADVGVTVIRAGTYAIGLHVGPYERLDETYLDVIGRWFPTSGYELAADAVVEHYLNDPACTEANDLRTEVRVRIAD